MSAWSDNDLHDAGKAPREPVLYFGVKRATCPTHGHGGCTCCWDVRPLSEVRAMTDLEIVTHLARYHQDPLVHELVRRLRNRTEGASR